MFGGRCTVVVTVSVVVIGAGSAGVGDGFARVVGGAWVNVTAEETADVDAVSRLLCGATNAASRNSSTAAAPINHGHFAR